TSRKSSVKFIWRATWLFAPIVRGNCQGSESIRKEVVFWTLSWNAKGIGFVWIVPLASRSRTENSILRPRASATCRPESVQAPDACTEPPERKAKVPDAVPAPVTDRMYASKERPAASVAAWPVAVRVSKARRDGPVARTVFGRYGRVASGATGG